jgi:hypothetical protein
MARSETTGRKTVTALPDDCDAFTVSEFCARHRISVQAFYKYLPEMPSCFFIGKRRLISRESAARWRAARELAAD